MTRKVRWGLAGLALLASGCVDAPQDEVSLDLSAQGSEVESLDLGSGLSVSLTRADLAFGPLYLCPGTQAGELCDTARLEWTESAVIDVLDPNDQALGVLAGVTGPVRSYMFDYGISSLLTQERPVVLDAAAELGDSSLVLEGEATIDGTSVPFSLEVIVQQSEETESGVPVVRKSTTERFDFEVTKDSREFSMTFSPEAWLTSMTRAAFEDALEPGACEIGTDAECPQVVFDSNSALSRSVGQSLTAGRRPEFHLE